MYRRLQAEGPRTVLLNTDSPACDFPRVAVDHRGGAVLATDYLIRNGHRRIAHLRGPSGQVSADERLAGYRTSLAAAAISQDSRLVVEQEYDYDGGAEAMRQLLRRRVPFSAVFAANDYMAIGAMQVLHHAGIRIPEDVSVIGFSGDSVGQFCLPSLTTVFEPAEDITVQALELLFQAATTGKAVPKITVPCRLEVRSSCRERILA